MKLNTGNLGLGFTLVWREFLNRLRILRVGAIAKTEPPQPPSFVTLTLNTKTV
ncbi:hypothetical protein IQ249_17725 [Lusitaniella coriacea LEGE 07157]|uniref:Uncharacterized protein n=1 Tax=Lusitaniella coriacea LEGE 07157 TaxID=945747 RepID=A0A8J7DYX4_9CYAN|nr:hypothetical protein [Lusitaniella coriacea]MBE9117740.1 hypothetical protein [Lusitaniella coriacea LEGE 07157]